MSAIEEAGQAYERQLEGAFGSSSVGDLSVWMLTYRPDSERRLRRIGSRCSRRPPKPPADVAAHRCHHQFLVLACRARVPRRVPGGS